MVIVSHLFSFLQKVSGVGVIRTNYIYPCLERSISRHPLFILTFQRLSMILSINPKSIASVADI